VQLTTDFDKEYQQAMKSSFWPDRTLLDFFDEAVARQPEHPAVISYNSDTGTRTALTYQELSDSSYRIALGFVRMGIGACDVVSMQLPNWWQVAAIHLACLRVGAVTIALMPVFRERELEFMLGLAEAKVLIVPESFRGVNHVEMARFVQKSCTSLGSVIAVGGSDGDAFEDTLLATIVTDSDRIVLEGMRPTPDDVIQIAYTSGTTGEPKGAMVTSNTLLSNVSAFATRLNLTADDITLMASPLAHQTGFMYGVMTPIQTGGTVVLQDVWQPDRAADIIKAEKVTFTMGALPFLADLTQTSALRPDAFATLNTFLCAGAPIPRTLVPLAAAQMGATILSGWGMTEVGAVTVTDPSDGQDKIVETDGCPLPGVELSIVGQDGTELPVGEEGDLKVRACSMFGGYLKRPELRNLDQGGWFHTGDVGRLDDDGYLRITGRSKDLVIRGGENIPVVEVEGLIFQHPDVQEVAIVGVPDSRMGERACAFVVLHPGTALTLSALCDFLMEQKIARQYLPERLEVISAMPRTSTGKVQKFKLREIVSPA
jgi:cyclohexanecarboxylate-CoA ligase